MVRDTPSHGSDHLCLIWKESIHNCRWYRADTACGTDGGTDRRTDGQTDGRSATSIPPQQLPCAGGIIRHVFYTTSSFNLCIISNPSGNWNWRYSPETANLGQNRRFFEPCDLRIWRMTLKNNRAPLLFYFKLCASFRSHWWIQTGVTVRKRPIWVKFDDF